MAPGGCDRRCARARRARRGGLASGDGRPRRPAYLAGDNPVPSPVTRATRSVGRCSAPVAGRRRATRLVSRHRLREWPSDGVPPRLGGGGRHRARALGPRDLRGARRAGPATASAMARPDRRWQRSRLEAPERFTYVRTNLDYVPAARRAELLRHLLDDVVARDGRLIVGVFNEELDRAVEESVRSWGFEVVGRAERPHPDTPLLVRRAFWVDAVQ